MADFTFAIKTPAELAGVEKAITKFEELRGAAKAAGKDYSDLDQRIATATASVEAYNKSLAATAAPTQKAADDSERYAKALEKMEGASHEARAEEAQRQIDLRNTVQPTKDLGDASDEAGKKFKLFAGQGETVKKVLNQITQESPLLGIALRAVISPVGAAVTAAGLIFRAFKADIDATNAKLDEMAARSATPLANFADNFRKAKLEATAANNEFVKYIQTFAASAAAAAQNSDAAVAAIRRLAVAQLELNNAAEAKATAQVKLGEASGQLTAPQAIAERQRIKDFYATESRRVKDQAEAAAIARQEQELSELQKQRDQIVRPSAPQDSTAARARALTLAQQAVAAGPLAEAARKQIPEAARKLEELETELARLQRIDQIGKGSTDYAARFQPQVDTARNELQELQLAARHAERLRRQSEDILASLENWKVAVTESEQAYQALTDQINAKARQLAEERATSALNRNVRDQTGGLQQETRSIESQIEIDRTRAQQQKEQDAANAKFGQDTNRAFKSGAPLPTPLSQVPDPTPDFLAYHAENMRVNAALKQALRDATSQLGDAANV